VKKLQDEGLPVKSLVIGNGTFEKSLSKLKHVVNLGWQTGNALGEAYASSDILLFPSDVETFGNVTLEALSAGIPAIVEKKCGEHLVADGVNGLTCPEGDFEAFYQATRRLVIDATLRRRMGKAARESAWKYERNIILQQMAENYKDAIQKHSDPTFLQKHMKDPEATGRYFLSIVCCDYFLIKKGADFFLKNARGVQDVVDGSSACVERTRLSCTDFLSSANLAQIGDEETGGLHHVRRVKENRKTCWSTITSYLCSTSSFGSMYKCLTFLFTVGVALLLIYASFAV